MEDGVDPLVLASVDEERRDLIKKLLMASAFVLPAVASFPMDALAQSGGLVIGMNGSAGSLNAKPGTETGPARKPGTEAETDRRGAPGSVGNPVGPGGPVVAPIAPTISTPPPAKPPTPIVPAPPPRRP